MWANFVIVTVGSMVLFSNGYHSHSDQLFRKIGLLGTSCLARVVFSCIPNFEGVVFKSWMRIWEVGIITVRGAKHPYFLRTVAY